METSILATLPEWQIKRLIHAVLMAAEQGEILSVSQVEQIAKTLNQLNALTGQD
ncbi:MAG: hypothetical protein Q4B82_09025 [Alysiella sp.]|uniref:hypothetical protein n=1 Tax=Alysiella sp. TaxID=1872483 RepID=UPI0026DB2BE0|nr:hypothetical protein [Alysiella sp.]MDO4434703.1 hypothetical protein [Alysiella sp.]